MFISGYFMPAGWFFWLLVDGGQWGEGGCLAVTLSYPGIIGIDSLRIEPPEAFESAQQYIGNEQMSQLHRSTGTGHWARVMFVVLGRVIIKLVKTEEPASRCWEMSSFPTEPKSKPLGAKYLAKWQEVKGWGFSLVCFAVVLWYLLFVGWVFVCALFFYLFFPN